MKNRLYIWGSRVIGAGAAVATAASNAFADGTLTMPTLPTADLYTAGTAILGLVAVAVVIGIVIRVFKKA
jgi:hypothetical protein